MLARTFGCVRVVWNQTLAARRARYAAEGTGTSYAQTDRALTQLKKDPELAFLNEVSSVPLQQALRHQHKAFSAFFGGQARYPRFKSRRGCQSAHYTRRAFTLRGGELRLAKMAVPVRFVWSWPDVDITGLDPAMVIVSRESDGRWYLTFTIDTGPPGPLEQTGRAVGVDLGVRDFAVTSDGAKIASPRHLERKARSLARYQQRLARCQQGSANRAKAAAKETCSACAHLLAKLSLGTRRWTCPACGARHDRDVNATKNIPAAGRAVAPGSPGDACGAGVRHSGSSRVRPAVKQEPRPVTAGIPVLQGGE